MILFILRDKGVDYSSVFCFIIFVDVFNYRRVIRKFLKMVGFCVVVEVCGVEGEEEGGEDSFLWCFCVVDYFVRYILWETYILWFFC